MSHSCSSCEKSFVTRGGVVLSHISTKRKGVEALYGITDLRYQQKISIILHVGLNILL